MTSLPAHKYIPGQTARHAEDAFEAIRARALSPTETANALQNPPWVYGLHLLEAGFYWEAHEVWEPVWLNARPNSAERFMCQSVIQIANAALKRDMGKPRAAERLCDMADGLLRNAGASNDAPMGVKPDVAIAAINLIREDITVGCRSSIKIKLQYNTHTLRDPPI